jgi:hypothetical protein
MALYWIGYDLNKPGQDYSELTARLQALGALRVLLSDWLLGNNNTTPEQIKNDVGRYLDSGDRIMVCELKRNAAWHNLRASDQAVLDMFNKWAS